jgi:hypothetical protein
MGGLAFRRADQRSIDLGQYSSAGGDHRFLNERLNFRSAEDKLNVLSGIALPNFPLLSTA